MVEQSQHYHSSAVTNEPCCSIDRPAFAEEFISFVMAHAEVKSVQANCTALKNVATIYRNLKHICNLKV